MGKRSTYIIAIALLLFAIPATAQVQVGGRVFGGGNAADVSSRSTVIINQTGATVGGDVYGGGALADVGTSSTDTTKVIILKGVIDGNVYGGGLGDSTAAGYPGYNDPNHADVAALVHGVVCVTIGNNAGGPTLNGSVFGCNNINGTPLDNVFVDIIKTAHTSSNSYPNPDITDIDDLQATFSDPHYADFFAIEAVYGGGNKASYKPSVTGRTSTVHVYDCDENTIKVIYGGGNAANVGTSTKPANTHLIIEGGRYDQIFGGGNGYSATNNHTDPSAANYNPGANIYGTATTDIQGGLYHQVFGGSNQFGDVNNVALSIDKQCPNLLIAEAFGGANLAELQGSVETNLGCGDYIIGSFYGGSNQADIEGSVTLNVFGGTYTNIFGGSKGLVAPDNPTPHQADSAAADITGAVTLNLLGGTIRQAFGGSNINGNIGGKITVNVLDTVASCQLQLDTVYGSGNLTPYTPNDNTILSPEVNILKGTVNNVVFGGGKGNTAVVTANPNVTIGDPDHDNYVAIVNGNVFGGGNAAAVTGNAIVTYNDNHASSQVAQLFGGGNAASVSGTTTVNMTLGKVTAGIYGGCNTTGEVGSVTMNLTGGQVGTSGARADVFGGGYGSATTTSGDIKVNLNGTTVYGDLYGGSALGSVNASTSDGDTITISSNTLHGTIYGGGKGQVGPTSADSITAVTNGNVVINYNTKNSGLTGFYGGANINGNVMGDITVNVNDTVGASGNRLDIFGGGLGAATKTEGSVTVTIGDIAGTKRPEIYGDIYGGSALGNVNNEAADLTKVDFLNGTLHGNIFGGGLGDADNAAKVNGEVQVNVSSSTQNESNCHIDLRGASIYGCNNTNGSPQADVTVNIWKTSHTASDSATYVNTAPSTLTYAIDQVFGGGKNANYLPEAGATNSTKVAKVYVHGCDNTIRRIFSGGDAAASTGVAATIDGGRFDYIFGGGNGEVTEANIGNGGTNLIVHGGVIGHLFGGSNTSGTISGSMLTTIDNVGGCTEEIGEFFGGGNLAPISTDLTTTIDCGVGTFRAIYGGSNAADITGDVTLNIKGGTITDVFGGSKGLVAPANPTPHQADSAAADITGNVTLNLLGGTVQQAFGGSNINGNITGQITVNVLDTVTSCPLQLDTVYGSGNLTPYTPTTAAILSPEVNVLKGTVNDVVFGGGKGETAIVTANPKVTIGDDDPAHTGYEAIVNGKVFGGGNAAAVQGNTSVLIQQSHSEADTIFGGGNLANVSGSTVVNVKGGTVNNDVYGGGALAHVGTNSSDSTIVTISGGSVLGDVYGGGLGQASPEIAALVNGKVKVKALGGTINNMFGCNNVKGAPQSTVQVIVNDTTTAQSLTIANVFGGGNLAAYTGTPDVDIQSGTVSGSVFGGGNEAGVGGGDVNVSGGQINTGVYGGCNTSGLVDGNITVDITGGTIGADGASANVHGGGYGNGTSTSGNVDLTINGTSAVIWGDVYGGSAKGHVNDAAADHTNVTLQQGTIHGDLYGGGLGDATYAALVNGAVQVTVNGGTVTGSVYGCNNANGAPQSTVKVDIYGTDTPGSGYALGNVFGGGNQAAYPNTPEVTIHNCNNSIGYVYGGGNAATVASTDVTIYGGNVIDNVFGGCYGAAITTGGTNVKIYGGTINHVYGGNNQSGAITGNINVTVEKTQETGHPLCEMHIGEVYGGGNVAASNAGNISIGCTGTGGTEGIDYVYGGANRANVTGPINLTIEEGRIANVFGGNNNSGIITGAITVNINKKDSPCVWEIGNVFGGGNHAAYSGAPVVTLTNGLVSHNIYGGGNEAGVGGSTVNINGGGVGDGVYGGCNTSGDVSGDITVNVKSGIIGNQAKLDTLNTTNVFGGGFGPLTSTSGNVTVSIDTLANATAPIIYGDVYGGSALGSVNASASNTTTVNVVYGTLKTETETGTTSNGQTYYIYHGGNVFGGGLGDPTYDTCGRVFGKVIVNIGKHVNTRTLDPVNDTLTIGNAVIEGNVYGCNNTNGSPQDDVTVNVYRTHRRTTDEVNLSITDPTATYSIANVFGGGNRANYTATDKTATVNIISCYNSIKRVFGGGNAAAAPNVHTNIQGGRFAEVFGGGNGEVSAANITGDVELEIHGGEVGEFFVGSNQNGTISGTSNVTVDQASGCDEIYITEFYCGGKYADFVGNIEATITCSEGMHVTNLYGGCKEAHVKAGNGGNGNVHLVVNGGIFENVYGGSRGTETKGADIQGNVLLEIFGGTVTNAIFGGSNVKGAIGGSITVNVEQKTGADYCPLDVSLADVYGGGNQADYPGVPSEGSPLTGTISHPSPYNYPEVNIKNATVKNVFGGGLEAEVAGNPQIHIKNGSKVLGNVYGGGNMGEVNGNPRVIINGKQTD